ncbi:MAG: DUF3108 domain-containing protein [Alphaproteobacteria bacterium]|nr:DUF3108 domain-containing protein [Alphaproteobacteria bacterium]
MPLIALAKKLSIYLIALSFSAAGLALPGHAGSDLARSQRLELAYNIYLGGFLAGSVDVTIALDGKRYRINNVARSHGVLDLLVNFRRQNDVMGQIIEHAAMPSKYAATGVWAGEARSVLVNYSDASGLRFTARPSALEDEREPVPAKLLSGTVDPFSALYQAILRYEEGKKCDGTSKVFDGRRRYDFLFAAVASRPVAGPLFSGSAYVCRVRQIPIAGFAKHAWLPQLIRPEWTDIWVAKVQDDLPALPVRLEADAGLGSMVAKLVAIGGRKYPPGEEPSEQAQGEAVAPDANSQR